MSHISKQQVINLDVSDSKLIASDVGEQTITVRQNLPPGADLRLLPDSLKAHIPGFEALITELHIYRASALVKRCSHSVLDKLAIAVYLYSIDGNDGMDPACTVTARSGKSPTKSEYRVPRLSGNPHWHETREDPGRPAHEVR